MWHSQRAGNDGLLIKFDLTRAYGLENSAPLGILLVLKLILGYRSNASELFVDHEAGILKIALQPDNDHVILSAR